jgi:hypothetical protein
VGRETDHNPAADASGGAVAHATASPSEEERVPVVLLLLQVPPVTDLWELALILPALAAVLMS